MLIILDATYLGYSRGDDGEDRYAANAEIRRVLIRSFEVFALDVREIESLLDNICQVVFR